MDKRKKTIATYDNYALSYQEKFMQIKLYNDTYDAICKLLPFDADILDVGCGPGNVTHYLLSKNPDFKITGIDLAPKMIKLAQANNPNADFTVMDCRDIRKLNRSFDGIVCAFCIPYLSKEETKNLIQDISGSLKSDGVVYVSAMEDDYDKSGFETTSFSGNDEVFIYYHQYEFIESELEESGLEVVEFYRKQYPQNNGFLIDMIFIAKKSK